MKFNFDLQEFMPEFEKRNKIIEQEFNERTKLETIPLDVLYTQLQLQSTFKKESILWITISPPQGDPLKFINRIHTLTERSYLPNLTYSFEQRGEQLEEVGKGLHCHLICDKKHNVAPKQVINNLASYFKISHNSVDVKKYPASYKQDKIDYLLGKKFDEKKDPKIQMDKIFRKTYSLNQIY